MCRAGLQAMSSSGKEAWLPGQPSVLIPRPHLTADAVVAAGYGGLTDPGRPHALTARRSPYLQPGVGAPVTGYRYHSAPDTAAARPPATTYRI